MIICIQPDWNKKKNLNFCVGQSRPGTSHCSADVTLAFSEITNSACVRACVGYGDKLSENLGRSVGGAACVLAVSISSFSEAASEGGEYKRRGRSGRVFKSLSCGPGSATQSTPCAPRETSSRRPPLNVSRTCCARTTYNNNYSWRGN